MADLEKIAEDLSSLTVLEAADLAKQMRQKRLEFRELVAERTVMDANTAEGQADNARFNSLVQSCLVDDTGKKIYSSLEDYENSDPHPYAIEAARLLAESLYGLDKDYDKTLPENEFLSQYKFVNEDLEYIDSQGRLIDEEGRYVNKDGRYVDYEEDGTTFYVDIDGNRVDADGKPKVDFEPFLDDDGKPVPVPEEAEAEDDLLAPKPSVPCTCAEEGLVDVFTCAS